MVENQLTNLFKGIENQSIAVNLLEESIKQNRIAPAYLFSGPQGLGQKECAIRFLEGLVLEGSENKEVRSRLVKLNHPDLLWVEPTYLNEGKLIKKSHAKDIGIKTKTLPKIRLEQVKEIKSFLSKKPFESRLGMIVIEDVEYINESAANALLKTLEEPINGILILISSRKEKLLNTIKSRCQEIPFKSINKSILKDYLMSYESTSLITKYQEEILLLSKGSPDLLKENILFLENCPIEILEEVQKRPSNYLEALSSAKKISEKLDTEEQVMLINFLQEHFWLTKNCSFTIKRLEKLRTHLLRSIQPRIAWEMALIEISELN